MKTEHKNSDSTMLFCFSPAVMMGTFVIEMSLALYTWWRYGLDSATRLAIAMLLCLAFFQLAEYMVCEGALGLSSLDWARLGYVAITLLPPLGIHLGLAIAGKKNPLLLLTAYGSAAAFSYFFLATGHGMQASQCMGNYVIFDIAPEALAPYTLYYFGWLLVGVTLAWRVATHATPHIGHALKGLAIGYLAFIIPTMVVVLLDERTIAAIPSIMCGFAVILAFTLGLWVIPEYKAGKKAGACNLFKKLRS